MGIQVDNATKDGQGKSLPYLSRQFISFKYGDRNIEDFGLLVVFKGDRLDKDIYAPFNDIVTEQVELDGQIFWHSNFKANFLNFVLATDGMTSKQLEDFKIWFQPGKEKSLVLSEHHNREIMARIATAPHLSLLPFEKEIEVMVGGEKIKTKTSLYKGEISLEFVMDDPYWYAKESIVSDLNQDSLKIIYEDGIPHKNMLKTSCFLANKQYCSYDKNSENADIISDFKGINLAPETNAYLYYCGSANSRPLLSFSFSPSFNSSTGKISFPGITEGENAFLQIGTENNLSLMELGLPSLFSSYNKALDIIFKYSAGDSILDLRKELRDSIYNYYTRTYVMALIEDLRNNRELSSAEGALIGEFKEHSIEQMKKFFENALTCEINCKNGNTIIKGKIKDYFSNNYFDIQENAGEMIKSKYLNISQKVMIEEGFITATNCLPIATNISLNNLIIDYKYMFL